MLKRFLSMSALCALLLSVLSSSAYALSACEVEVKYADNTVLTVEQAQRDESSAYFGETVRKRHDCDFCRRHARNNRPTICASNAAGSDADKFDTICTRNKSSRQKVFNENC